jgi:hypothetical protein
MLERRRDQNLGYFGPETGFQTPIAEVNSER